MHGPSARSEGQSNNIEVQYPSSFIRHVSSNPDLLPSLTASLTRHQIRTGYFNDVISNKIPNDGSVPFQWPKWTKQSDWNLVDYIWTDNLANKYNTISYSVFFYWINWLILLVTVQENPNDYLTLFAAHFSGVTRHKIAIIIVIAVLSAINNGRPPFNGIDRLCLLLCAVFFSSITIANYRPSDYILLIAILPRQ